jgi:hypothetical protein
MMSLRQTSIDTPDNELDALRASAQLHQQTLSPC